MQEKPAKAKGGGKTGKQNKAKGDGKNNEQKHEAKDGGKNDEQKHEAKGEFKNDEQKHEAKGGGKNDGLKRKLSVILDDNSLSTPPAAVKEAPGSDPLQKKARAPRKGKGKGSKRASTGKGNGLEKSADKQLDDEVQLDKSTDKGEQQEENEVPDKSADKGEQQEDNEVLDKADDEPVARPKGTGKKGKNMKRGSTPRTAAQEAASAKSQAVADKNLLVIRQLAGQHPELQPQLGFTNKILGKLS